MLGHNARAKYAIVMRLYKRARSGMARQRQKVSQWVFSAVEILPLLLPAVLTAFGCVAIALLLMGQLKDMFVWPLGILAACAAAIPVIKYGRVDRPGGAKERRITDWLVVAGVVVWGGFNMLYTSQHILTNRDPATYGVAGAWLIHHDNIKMNVPDVLGTTPRVVGSSAGFEALQLNDKEPHVYAQGMHLLPAFLGLSGRIAGEELMLRVSPFFGMTALLAVYGFARLLVRPRWAALATAVLAVSLPLIYFSRDTYTEPLALTFTFGALSLLWVAQKQKNLWLWLLAGLVTGAGVLTRIDAYLTIAGIVFFAAIMVVLAARRDRATALKQAGVLAAGITLPSFLGWLDVSLLSPGYYDSVKSLLKLELLAIAIVAAAGVVATVIAWRTRVLVALDKATRRWRGTAIVVLIVLIAAGLASRPLWYTAVTSNQNPVVAEIQQRMGDPIEKRSYAEQSVNWVVWYIGPLFALLGVVGVALAAKWSMARRDLLLVASVAVVLVTSLVYLVKPSITADQIWASRRLLPVILPGLLVFGAVALDRMHSRYFNKHRYEWIVVGGITCALVIMPLLVSKPFLRMRELTQLASIQAVCQAVPKNGVVLWIGLARLEALQPTRAYCGIDAMGYNEDVFKTKHFAQAAHEARKAGKVVYIGVYGKQLGIFEGPALKHMTEINKNSYQVLEQTLDRPPFSRRTQTDSIQLGILREDGSIASIR
jgi:4-amino-4-deoxy-L-arabinose transferase-like glycosyltransferase